MRTAHRRRKVTAEEREIYKAQQQHAESEARKGGEVTFKSLYGSVLRAELMVVCDISGTHCHLSIVRLVSSYGAMLGQDRWPDESSSSSCGRIQCHRRSESKWADGSQQ